MSLSLLTYNIHSCIGTDRRFAPDRIARFISRVDADVVALQEVGWHHRGEVGFDQFDFLARETGYKVIQGLTKNHARAHYGNAILTRRPVTRVLEHDLSVPNRLIPRQALEVDLDLEGRSLRIINVHLGLDPWERKGQIARLIQTLDGQRDTPTVLLGDTNEWRRDGSALSPLAERLPGHAAPATFHTRLPRLPYDRIFLSAHLRFIDFDVLRSGEAARASDHLPLYARVAYS